MKLMTRWSYSLDGDPIHPDWEHTLDGDYRPKRTTQTLDGDLLVDEKRTTQAELNRLRQASRSVI